MKSLVKYIKESISTPCSHEHGVSLFEYKGHAIRNEETSAGDPDEIKHYFAQGWVHLKFSKDNAYPYIYNFKLDKIIIGDANTIHNDLFIPDNEDKLKEMGLDGVDNVQRLRYCCGIDDDTELIDNWYEENKQYIDNTICGRIWYDAQDNFETWDLDQQEQMASTFDALNDLDSCKCYTACWNEIEPSKFQDINDAIVKHFAKEHSVKIKSYIAIDNNGNPIELVVGKGAAKVDARSVSHQKEVEKAIDIHNPAYGESWEEFRKRKREATKGYNKARGEHFQHEYYDKTDSKTSAEWHNNKTKRYNPRTGKMEWGEKIGDSLQKSLIDFLYD